MPFVLCVLFVGVLAAMELVFLSSLAETWRTDAWPDRVVSVVATTLLMVLLVQSATRLLLSVPWRLGVTSESLVIVSLLRSRRIRVDEIELVELVRDHRGKNSLIRLSVTGLSRGVKLRSVHFGSEIERLYTAIQGVVEHQANREGATN